jgi:predicted transposase YdaD
MRKKRLDATMRDLYELEPAAWMEFLGIPVPDPHLVRVIDSNLSTVTAEADKVVWIGGPEPVIVHTEFVSGRDRPLPKRLHWYNTLVAHHHDLPVWTVVVLLQHGADGPELTGVYEKAFPGRGQNLWFVYDVIRVWREPPEKLLTAGLPVLPLAPVSDVAPDRLAEVATAVAERLKREADPELMKTLWTSTAILMGLRYPREQVAELIEGVANMVLGIRGIEESWVYQDIFAKGRAEGRAEGEAKGRAEGEAKGRAEGEAKGRAEGEVEEARQAVLHLGRKKFGPPSERVEAEITTLGDLDRLNGLLDRILDVAGWEELLSPPSPPA